MRSRVRCVLMSWLVLASAVSAVADDPLPPPVHVEAESFSATCNIGGYGIQIHHNPLTQVYSVWGVDVVGEFVDIPVAINQESTYTASLLFKGDLEIDYAMTITMIPVGQPVGPSYTFGFTGAGYS